MSEIVTRSRSLTLFTSCIEMNEKTLIEMTDESSGIFEKLPSAFVHYTRNRLIVSEPLVEQTFHCGQIMMQIQLVLMETDRTVFKLNTHTFLATGKMSPLTPYFIHNTVFMFKITKDLLSLTSQPLFTEFTFTQKLFF